MKGLVVISLIIFIGYILWICKSKGIPTSISESYYLLPKKWQWLFTIFMYSIAFLVVPTMLNVLEGSNAQALGFLAVVALVAVGAAPLFKSKDSMERPIHKISAIIAAVCAECIMIFVLGYWYIALAGALAIIYPIVKQPQNKTFWLEIGCFVPMYISLLIA